MASDRTVTVKSSGGTYSDLNTALSTEATDLTAATGSDERLIIECYNLEDTTAVAISGAWVTNYATGNYVWIKAVDNHGGKWSTSAYRLNVSTLPAFDNSSLDDMVVTGLQIRSTGATSGSRVVRMNSGLDAGTILWEKNIIISDQNTAYVHGVDLVDTSPTYCFRNNLIYCFPRSGGAGAFRVGPITADLFYNTLAGFTYGIALIGTTTSGVVSIGNRIYQGSGLAPVYQTTGTLDAESDYNMTDSDASTITNWGANSLDSGDAPTFSHVDDTNSTLISRDYHLSTGDSGIGIGPSMSTDGGFPFTDDIDGETR